MRAEQRGYAAIMLVLVMTVASLAALADRLDAGQLKRRRDQEAAAALQFAKVALLGYAITYRDRHPTENFGHLPCPDVTGSGIEQTPCGRAGTTAVGLLPVKTLGLPDLRDADGNCLWYAVSGSFKSNPKTFPFNWDSQGALTIRNAAGGLLAAPDDAAGGAAAVVIAAGPPLATQHRSGAANDCRADPAEAVAYLESHGDAFTQGVVHDASGAAIANDRVAWVTPVEIFDVVVRRSDFAAFMDAGTAAMRAKLGSQRTTAGNALPSNNPFGRQTSDYSFYAAWSDQFRYLRCARKDCYDGDDGAYHDAVLLFGGRSSAGGPRPSTRRAPADYFESALAMAEGREFHGCAAGAAAFDNSGASSRAQDMALCLAP
jgi:type II secretory pathway pseudopilin PulG